MTDKQGTTEPREEVHATLLAARDAVELFDSVRMVLEADSAYDNMCPSFSPPFATANLFCSSVVEARDLALKIAANMRDEAELDEPMINDYSVSYRVKNGYVTLTVFGTISEANRAAVKTYAAEKLLEFELAPGKAEAE